MDVTIEQCRAWTLEHNLELKVAMIDPQVTGAVLSEEEARFESAFFARVSGSDGDEPGFVTFPDRDPSPFEFDPGVRIPLRTGGEAVVRFPMSHNETIGGVNPIDGVYSTDIEVGLVQPLLRGAGRRTSTHPIRIASLESRAAEARTKLEVIRQIAAVDRAYWLLWEAANALEVRQRQYERAGAQLEEAKARFDARVGPQIEVWRAEAGVSRRLEAILIAANELRDRQRTFKRIVNAPGADVDSPVAMLPVTTPSLVRYEVDPPALVERALSLRAELLEQELRIAQSASTIDFENNQALPLCTLDYVYRVDGKGDTMGDSISSAGDWESDGWILGVSVEIPVGNQAARSRVHRAVLERLQRLATRDARRQQIKLEVLSALDNLETTRERINASSKNVELERRNFEAEQGQYRLGLRNSTDVLDAETQLAEARIAEIEAVVDYQIAQIDLAFATGTLLGAARVSWDADSVAARPTIPAP